VLDGDFFDTEHCKYIIIGTLVFNGIELFGNKIESLMLRKGSAELNVEFAHKEKEREKTVDNNQKGRR